MSRHLTDTRVWLVGGALSALLIAVVGWTVLIGPRLSETAELRARTADTSQQNETLRREARTLEEKSTRLAEFTSSLRNAQAALPYDSGLPAFTRQINAQARASGVVISSVVVGAVTPVVPATPTAGAVSGLFSMQVTIESSGQLRRQVAFMGAVRTAGPRRVLISAMQLSPGLGSKQASIADQASLSTQLQVFSAPKTPDQVRRLRKLLSGDIGS